LALCECVCVCGAIATRPGVACVLSRRVRVLLVCFLDIHKVGRNSTVVVLDVRVSIYFKKIGMIATNDVLKKKHTTGYGFGRSFSS
jgi:hypothetical protein